ncbi:TerD family protein [Streptomyces sp. P17]|uniref:TerD family protein n=1 Tax=Streptomyces sp. P17 TaxID=3074716 RepID=UPI0028F435C8|nr:TerD family protein [Streptomyces sp. P17]MDT9699692.1 TerD family protein [Streptomyces sp. P17]
MPGLAAQTVAPDGSIVAHYEVTDAASETAFVLGEFYRRNGEWKFRAVGQGYDPGLAGLATDFGNPGPGRPSLVEYDFPGAAADYSLEVKVLDEYGDEDEWLVGTRHGTRGVAMMFTSGSAERTVRVKHSGDWTLRLLPEEDAPLITGPAEGKGTTVLRWPGPPTLMRVKRTSLGKEGKLAAYAVNHPFGKSVIIADTNERRRPVLGPVFVDPGGSCFVIVSAVEGTKWLLSRSRSARRPCSAPGPRTAGTESYVTSAPSPRGWSPARAASSTCTNWTKTCFRSGKSPVLPARTA